MRTGCPDDFTLDSYVFGGISAVRRLMVGIHLKRCPECRSRVDRALRFGELFRQVAPEEPPEDFCAQLTREVFAALGRGNLLWSGDHAAATGAVMAERDRNQMVGSGWHLAAWLKWLAGIALAVAGSFAQLLFSDYLQLLQRGDWASLFSLSLLQDIRGLIGAVESGAAFRNLEQFVAALRVDGLSCLTILGATLPSQICSVIVFSGIVSAVMGKRLSGMVRFMRSEGKGR